MARIHFPVTTDKPVKRAKKLGTIFLRTHIDVAIWEVTCHRFKMQINQSIVRVV